MAADAGVSIVLRTSTPRGLRQAQLRRPLKWAPWDSNPARRIKSPVLYQMS